MVPPFTGAPWLYRMFSPHYLLCSLPVQKGDQPVVALTFDDGPTPDVTPAVLEILAKKGVQATFFCLGGNVAANPLLFNDILEYGHEIGNHTWQHLHGWKQPPGAYVDDVIRCETLFQTSLFRPPYGKFTPSQYWLLRKQYRFILWSLLTHDFQPRLTPDQCLRLALENTHPGDIVVFHDSVKAAPRMLFALPRYIDELLLRGYSFATIPRQIAITTSPHRQS